MIDGPTCAIALYNNNKKKAPNQNKKGAEALLNDNKETEKKIVTQRQARVGKHKMYCKKHDWEAKTD